MRKKSKEFEIELSNGEKVKLYIRRPTQRDIFSMDKIHRIAMTELLAAGVASNHKLAKILETNGEWTRQDENDLNNFGKMIAAHSKALKEEHENHTEDENDATAQKTTEIGRAHV